VDYIPVTQDDRRAMLEAIGVSSVEDLFAQIPNDCRLKRQLDLPQAMSEPELISHLTELAARNKNIDQMPCFLGAGAYDHFIPAIVEDVARKSELYTAYTPYQAEISQGILQVIYEFQTLICELTAMDISNASVYDGATALSEAVLMAVHTSGCSRIVLAGAVNPQYVQTVRTYVGGLDITVEQVPWTSSSGQVDLEALRAALRERAACVVVQHPNFFGLLEPMDEISTISHAADAQVIASVDPISLGLLKPPGAFGVDIAVGEAQGLGNALSFGGPYVGFLACTEQYMRRIPGRVVGEAYDANGQRGFVLALQTREQHIRRGRATSNICTNQALCALIAAAYLEAMGKQGLREVAELCLQKAHYCAEQIEQLDGFSLRFSAPFFKEFVVTCPSDPVEINKRLLQRGIIGGLPLNTLHGPAAQEMTNAMLICVTEQRTREQIERFVKALDESIT